MSVKLTPLKRVASINSASLDDTASPGRVVTYADISDVSQGKPVRWQDPMAFKDAPSRARRLVSHNDTLMSTVRTYLRAVTRVVDPPPNAVVSTGFAVIRPRSIDAGFLGYALQSDIFIDEVVARSVGVSYPAISPLEIGGVKVPVPRQPEQGVIADFLDHETAEIDAFVSDQIALIALLNERRLSTIDSYLLTSESLLTPLKYLGRLRSGITLGAKYDQETRPYPYLRVANVQTDRVDLTNIAIAEVPKQVAENNRLLAGDVLMTEGGDRDKLGRGALWNGEVEGMLHQNHVFAFRPNADISAAYLVYVLESSVARHYFDVTAKQSTNLASTNSTLVRNFRLPLPGIETQGSIVAHLDAECAALHEAVRDAQKAIELSQERRAALITAAVNGQIDVTQGHKPVAEQLEEEVLQKV